MKKKISPLDKLSFNQFDLEMSKTSSIYRSTDKNAYILPDPESWTRGNDDP